MPEFFTKPQNIRKFKEVSNRLLETPKSPKFSQDRNDRIRFILLRMSNEGEKWDLACQVNITWIGEDFLEYLDRISIINKDDNIGSDLLDMLFAMIFRFVYEANITLHIDGDLDLNSLEGFAKTNLHKFDEQAIAQINFGIRDLPGAIVKHLIHSSEFELHRTQAEKIAKFEKSAANCKEVEKSWNENLDEKLEKVTALKSQLDNYKTAFNFVGLYEGFNDLSVEKRKEKNVILTLLFFIGLILLAVLSAELIYLDNVANKNSIITPAIGLMLVPVLSIVAVLIYFFKVALSRFNSVKSQLVQIELRKTLCQFIQGYSEYSKELKENGEDTLTKFESLIFSEISTSPDPKHSPYEALEGIGKVLQHMKSKS